MGILPYIGQLTLYLAAALAIVRWKHFSPADRIVGILLIVTVVQETISFGMVRVMHRNNMVTYHIYSPVELLLICLWLYNSHAWKRARAFALSCGVAGCLLSLLNSIFLQSIHIPNTYFLLIEGALIIQLSLTSIAGLVMRESADPYRMVHFWIALDLIFYWSITLVAYGMIGLTTENDMVAHHWARIILLLANILFYTALGVIFLRYKKLIPSGA